MSLSYFEGTALAVIAHGSATIIRNDRVDFAQLDELQVGSGRQSPREWEGEAVYIKVEAATVFTYARHPERLPPEPVGIGK